MWDQQLPFCSWFSNASGPEAVCGTAGDDSGEMFLKSVLQVAPSPRVPPCSSLHVLLAINSAPRFWHEGATNLSYSVLRLYVYRVVREDLTKWCSQHFYACFRFIVLSGEMNRDRAGLAGQEGCLLELGKYGRKHGWVCRDDGRIFYFAFFHLWQSNFFEMLLKTPPSIFSNVSRDSRRVESMELVLPVHRENRMYLSSESTALCSVEMQSFQGAAHVRSSSLLLF